MHASLTRRYLLALGIVAAVLVFSYAGSRHLQRAAGADARLINVSGEQRMLSQRIALLATDVALRETGVSRRGGDDVESRLLDAVARMQANRAELRRDWISGGLGGAWTRDDRLVRLDERVQEYLRSASLLGAEPSGPAAAARADALHAEATSDLLPALDDVVVRYQRQADERVGAALVRERVQLIIGLAVLLVELLFIFRPMVVSTVAAVHRLQRANGRLRDVGYRLSHDLRAPVASSIGLASLARESLDEDDAGEARFALGELDRSLEGLDRHIADMNRSIENPEVAEEIEPLQVRALVTGSLDRLSHMPAFERLHVDVRAAPSLTWRGQRKALQSVLENLLSNAVKYADPARARSTLDIEARREGLALHIVVSDNGLGVPVEARERLFERHERCHPGHAEGSGLGLYLAREAAERLGGSLVYRPLREGSRFVLTLPDGYGIDTNPTMTAPTAPELPA